MEKQILGIDKDTEQKLRTSTNFACFCLNRCVFPIATGLKMHIDIRDKETLLRYVRSLEEMKGDYVGGAINGVENPALKRVAKDVTERQWEEIAGQYQLPNQDILLDIVDNAMDFVIVWGDSVDNAKAIANNTAIQEASVIVATEEDAKKKAELKRLCEEMNRVFNGAGEMFAQYICFDKGAFMINPKAINFKPLFNGK